MTLSSSKDDAFLAYLAGFFDGEGSVGIYPNGTKQGRTLRVQITQTITAGSTALLRECQARWGGCLCEFNKAQRRTAWNWQASAAYGADALRSIRPWLRLKAEQADIALAWWDNRPPRERDASGRMRAFPPEVVASAVRADLALRAAKMR